MKTNEAGIALIKEFEGCRLHAYPDPGTGDEPITIGYGHTGGVSRAATITQEQADQFLLQDLAQFESNVTAACEGVETNENQLSAMVAFCFNVGQKNFAKSSVLKAHRRGDKVSAANAFSLWNKAAGKVLPGLTRRRAAEAQLYLTPIVSGPAVQTRTTPDAEKPVATRKTVIGTAAIAVTGAGQQLVQNLPQITAAHAQIAGVGGFSWVVKILGALMVLAALYVLFQQYWKRRKGEA